MWNTGGTRQCLCPFYASPKYLKKNKKYELLVNFENNLLAVCVCVCVCV